MKTLAVLAWAGLSVSATVPLSAQLSPRDSALHALNRLAYGPRPGEVDRVVAGGVANWIDRQLDPDGIANPALAAREREFNVLRLDRNALARVYVEGQRERRARQLAASRGMDSTTAMDEPGPKERVGRRLAGQYMDLTVTRAVLSERQLYEVMVDFWTNRFNVFLGKGADRFLLPDYIEHAIRAHAMGSFADLLIATAESPAMLFYLDNWQSVAPDAVPPRQLRPEVAARMPKGINENYARELLELHTLGVDGGYTQQDVINVARIFTGWTIERPRQGGGFQFHAWAHDAGAKAVMGVSYPAGHGMDEGVHLLRWLAEQPATMHHVSRELCERLVRDDPPDGCVDDAVAAWRRSGGEIREVVRAIVRGPDFWAPASVGAKVKTPLEFVVSALRAVAADPDTSSLPLAQVVARLGEPLYMHVAPDGYPERQEDWVNSGALLNRMSVGVALAAGRLPGASVDLDAVLPASDGSPLIAAVDRTILAGTMSARTKEVIAREVSDVKDPGEARALAVGLALGGPEFQRQ